MQSHASKLILPRKMCVCVRLSMMLPSLPVLKTPGLLEITSYANHVLRVVGFEEC